MPEAPPRALVESALLESWFRATVEALSPAALVRARVPELAWDRYAHILVLALGKAAGSMLEGWLHAVAPELRKRTRIVLALPEGAAAPAPVDAAGWDLATFRGGHPQLNADSLRAAAAMLVAAERLAGSAGVDAPGLMLTLISGGGSALVEMPLRGDRTPSAQRLNRALVASGAPIGDINIVRKHASAFKGGRLAVAAASPFVDQVSWILSDVPGGDLGAVASGPTHPDASTLTEARAVLKRWLPGETCNLEETPKPGHAAFARSQWRCLADNADACAHVAGLARAAGYAPVEIDATADEWESVQAARYFAGRWRQLRGAHARPCLIAGGEVRVRTSGATGRGGRNQDLALRVAGALAGEAFCFLSAGTDGVDGSSDAAGAIVDGSSWARARAAGHDPETHLRHFNAEPLLAAIGALIHTGPTGNNLRDVRVFV